MCASAELLLGLGVEDSSWQGCDIESVISLTVSHNSLGLGWNTAADLWGILCNNIDCLINQVNVGVFLSNSLTFRMPVMSVD